MGILDFKSNTYSQNGEDGILQEVFKRLNITKGNACEFGSADGYFCSNTRLFIDQGWECVMLDMVNGQFVTPENVNELVPAKLDLLSIDIDGNDYAVWAAYQGYAKVVVIEINSSLDPEIDYFTKEHGANFSIMEKLAYSKGYFLLAHTGNMIFVDKEVVELFPDKDHNFDKSFRV
jgi:hypothetical protein